MWVKPDELRIEQPYLERNIETDADGLQARQRRRETVRRLGHAHAASLEQDAPTVKNIRLWDPRPLIATYRQLQEIRLYYDFRDVDIDRYWINGEYTEVMLSPRELNIDLLPDNAQTWVNRHLKFTHGSGLVMSPVNTKDSEGLPVFYIKNIPAESDVGLKITQPAIYFGEEPDNYAIVNSATPEFDYPTGADNVSRTTRAAAACRSAGCSGGCCSAIFYRDINLLVTENIVDGSKIMIRRNISDRIARLAPFLGQDRDPYIVLHDGRLVWIVDCYTTSDHYPYSQRNPDQINYIRNSVKVVVDAYTGDHRFLCRRSRRSDHPDLAADLPGDVQADVRDAGGFAPAHPLSRRLLSDPGRHLSHLSHDRSAGVLQPRGPVGFPARELRRRDRPDAAVLRNHAAAGGDPRRIHP